MVTVGRLGVTWIDCNTAGVTVRLTDAWTLPEAALMVVVPTLREVASPKGLALLIVATVLSLDDQTTVLVRSCVVLSVYVPVAVNTWLVPSAMLGAGGVI